MHMHRKSNSLMPSIQSHSPQNKTPKWPPTKPAYGATSFVAYNAANGVNVDKAAYKSCIEKTNDGSLTSTGALCIFDCVQYTFSAVFAVLSGGYGISIVENGIGGAQQTQAADLPKGDGSGKRRSTYEQALLDAFNRRMEAVQDETGYRAAAVVASQVHPYDDLAYRLNIRDEAENHLHLHTNGSHAMALFHVTDATDSNELAPRQRYLDTQGHYYTFSGLDGLKIEWHNINRNPDGTADDSHFLEPWIRSDFQKEPIMSTSDVWDFQACNIEKTATYYGRLVFELNRPGFNYEDITPRGC